MSVCPVVKSVPVGVTGRLQGDTGHLADDHVLPAFKARLYPCHTLHIAQTQRLAFAAAWVGAVCPVPDNCLFSTHERLAHKLTLPTTVWYATCDDGCITFQSSIPQKPKSQARKAGGRSQDKHP